LGESIKNGRKYCGASTLIELKHLSIVTQAEILTSKLEKTHRECTAEYDEIFKVNWNRLSKSLKNSDEQT
jgi:hypothetical protein